MKFYYKDQLIRTSKTHAYNWAILTERPDGTYACHGCRVNRSDADSEASPPQPPRRRPHHHRPARAAREVIA